MHLSISKSTLEIVDDTTKFFSQSFEDVIADLGQVLKINHANKLYTRRGREIRGFSHLRNDFYDEDTFYVSQGPVNMTRVAAEEDDDERDSWNRGSQSPGSIPRLVKHHLALKGD